MILRFVSLVLLIALVVNGVSASSEDPNICVAPQTRLMSTIAQESDVCVAPDLGTLTAARDACESISAGQVCLGAGEVETASDVGALALPGETIDLADVESITSTAGSLALLKMQADLPEDSEPIQLVLFGDASVTNAFAPLEEPYPTVTVRNTSGNILNLRAAPGLTAQVLGTMGANVELTADGRSADGEWLHVLRENDSAWVFASLVTVNEGEDAGTLYLLDTPITQHMQSLTLETTTGDCGGGLLVQSSGRDSAHLEVNGALLTFSDATLLLQANDALTVQVINGSADVMAQGAAIEAETGSQVTVALDAAPELQDRYAFVSLVSAPLDLLPQESLVCVAGVSGSSVPLYSIPGTDNESIGELASDTHVNITGQTTADDGTLWYLVDNTRWVAQDSVITAGVCGDVAQVSPNAAQTANVSVPPQQASFDHTLLSPDQTIWQAHTGVDNLSGTCSAPPIAQCDHLAAIIPQGNGNIAWRGQEPQPYPMFATGQNSFSYSGRNGLNSANVSFSLTLTSESTWTGTMQYVFDNDPGCTHTFYYTADRIR